MHAGGTSSGVAFDVVYIKEFFFEHAATVLVVQGMVLQDFFPPDVYFKHAPYADPIARGPFLLLKGELSQPWDPPLRLKNMVLARVNSVPEGMKREELLGHLLRAVG